MKQKSIFALVLSAILVLTFSGTETAFADYNEYNDDRNDDYDKENDRDNNDRNDDDRNDDDRNDDDRNDDDRNDDRDVSDDKWKKEKRS